MRCGLLRPQYSETLRTLWSYALSSARRLRGLGASPFVSLTAWAGLSFLSLRLSASPCGTLSLAWKGTSTIFPEKPKSRYMVRLWQCQYIQSSTWTLYPISGLRNKNSSSWTSSKKAYVLKHPKDLLCLGGSLEANSPDGILAQTQSA